MLVALLVLSAQTLELPVRILDAARAPDGGMIITGFTWMEDLPGARNVASPRPLAAVAADGTVRAMSKCGEAWFWDRVSVWQLAASGSRIWVSRNPASNCVSTDTGETWSERPWPDGAWPGTLQLSSTGEAWAWESETPRLWVSRDEGATWETRQLTLPAGARKLATVTADPFDGQHLVAAFFGSGAAIAAYAETRDGWRTWQPLAFEVSFDPVTPGLAYGFAAGGLMVTEDGGRAWRRAGPLPYPPAGAQYLPAGAGGLLARAWTSIDDFLLSTDSGATWSPYRGPLPAAFSPGVWWARTPRGLARSQDQGRSWTVQPLYPQWLVAAGDGVVADVGGPFEAFVMKLAPGGETVEWSRFLGKGLGLPLNQRVELNGAGEIFVSAETGVYRVSPDGQSSQRLVPEWNTRLLGLAEDGGAWVAVPGALRRVDAYGDPRPAPAITGLFQPDRLFRRPSGDLLLLEGARAWRLDAAGSRVLGELARPADLAAATVVIDTARQCPDGTLWLGGSLSRPRSGNSRLSALLVRISAANEVSWWARPAAAPANEAITAIECRDDGRLWVGGYSGAPDWPAPKESELTPAWAFGFAGIWSPGDWQLSGVQRPYGAVDSRVPAVVDGHAAAYHQPEGRSKIVPLGPR